MYVDKVITWTHDPILDSIYENLRSKHYANTSHRLYNNYGPEHVAELSAKSIYWGLDGQPKIVCSILARSCWPADTYRILNRLWKPEINSDDAFSIDKGFALLIQDQINWCKENDAQAVFMSRQTPGRWQEWAAGILNKMTGISFHLPNERFLTCSNEDDESCWQRIIFTGDVELLNNWKNRPANAN
jgi:hypothetical protein